MRTEPTRQRLLVGETRKPRSSLRSYRHEAILSRRTSEASGMQLQRVALSRTWTSPDGVDDIYLSPFIFLTFPCIACLSFKLTQRPKVLLWWLTDPTDLMIELEPNNVHHFLLPYFLLDLTLFAPVCMYQHVKYPWVPKSFALHYFHSIYSNVSIWYCLKYKGIPFLFPTWLLISLLMFSILLQMLLSFLRLL